MTQDKRSIAYFIYLFYLLTIIGLALILVPDSHAQESDIKSEIRHSAFIHGIDPALALAIAEIESGLNPHALGKYGEIGLFQLRPEFHSVRRDQTAKQNADIAMKFLTYLKNRCVSYNEAWFVCFNYGPNSNLHSPRSTNYYRKVMAAKHKYETTGRFVCSGN